MKILVISTHPNIEDSKVNIVLTETLKNERNIKTRFLDEIYPNKIINIKTEQKYLLEADRIVFQFPFYWYNMPSLLRDYFDQVLEFGWAYGPNGDALKGKEFIIAVTIGAPEYSYQGGSYNNFTITELLRPYEATSNALQMIYLPYFAVFDTPRLTNKDIKNTAIKYIKHIQNEDLDYRKVLENLKAKNKDSSFVNL